MKVAILSFSMLFQTQGGLQIQILETIAALKRRGVEATLIDPNVQSLTDFDIVHIFSAINGSHRIAEHAKMFGLPVVTSPLIRPHWTRQLGCRARFLERLVGKLTAWSVKTEYRQIESCLTHSDCLIALGNIERDSITAAFLIPSERIKVIPNGIPSRFFDAKPEAFFEHVGIKPGFVLNVASINSHKNQLTLAQALAGSGRSLVLVGECLPSEQPYLEKILQQPNTHYLGKLAYDDPLLASAYAAAGVFCLPSLSEVMPLSILESLAAGTPVVTTRHHCMDIQGMTEFIREVEPHHKAAIREAIESFIAKAPARDRCCNTVRKYTWDAVAEEIHQCYLQVLRR